MNQDSVAGQQTVTRRVTDVGRASICNVTANAPGTGLELHALYLGGRCISNLAVASPATAVTGQKGRRISESSQRGGPSDICAGSFRTCWGQEPLRPARHPSFP